MIYKDPEHLFNIMHSLWVDYIGNDIELYSKLCETDIKCIRFDYSSPDLVLYVSDSFNGIKVSGVCNTFNNAIPKSPAEVTLSMSADFAHRFWMGKENLPLALMQGRIKATGPVHKILSLLPLITPAFSYYKDVYEIMRGVG